ncbi:MAG: HAMP domain-containing histidine kinase [Gemmataceae bacterium]|nr:HAMP domain-containing histidine kinase [Gemmataceae bacterium]MDW8264826.1 HAMP domain-containing sensor histidine kinase [Gemmataceae bacterium]
MRRSLRYQLLVPLATLLVGIVGISSWTAWASASHARRQLEHQVRQVARTLSDAHFPLTARVLEQMKGLSGAEFLLIGTDGSRLATLTPEVTDLPAAEPVTDWQQLDLGPAVTVGGQVYLCGGVVLRPPAGQTLYILYPEALWRDAWWEAVRPALVVGSVASVASLGLALGMTRRLARRLRELDRQTRRIAAGDFSPMPLPEPDDELRDLGRAVNDMAQRLAQMREAIRQTERLRLLGQVSGGLAHQLRNAVTGARLAIELHARDCPPDIDRETLDVALRELKVMEVTLKRFLDLGRPDAPSRQACSLGQLIDEAVALLRPRCRHARIDLRWQAPDWDSTLVGDPGQLGQVVLNLLTNAADAAGPGGWVEIRLSAVKAPLRGHPTPAIRVEVLDSGPGPPPEIADRLFEPFVTGKPDGVGLGLASCKHVLEAHGGRLGWGRGDGVTRFWLELPRDTASLQGTTP